jgi:BMP-binding endothelial regulator protein
MEKCPPLTCLAGYKQELPQGQCCHKCVESESVCTVFGDPHYKTFDGKFYTFEGSCKYQLTADCLNDTFSIRITNDARSTRYSSWAKTVSLKMGNTKINLGKKMRVKVDGLRVVLPHMVSDGTAVIERRENFVSVNTSLGIRLLWDGEGFLEVAAPTSFKESLCGLCGNYNSAVRDDLELRDGGVLKSAGKEDVWKFGESWRVGGRKACSREDTLPRRKPCSKSAKKIANRTCKFFNKSEAFAACRHKLNPDNYFEACIADMCQCRTKTCYCDAFGAYARECQRIGAALDDWRRETGCGLNKRSGKLFVRQRQRHSRPVFSMPIEPFSRPPPAKARRPPPNLH